ncbi:MAG: BspA family leucine-rich repeat surface protein [Prevotella sp.]|nr:BspA family leucine-rich repeat surface protein [Prevotella sp.]
MKRKLWIFVFALVMIAQGAMAEEVTIASASDWDTFASRVNAGETSLDARMTQDVDLANHQTKVGTSSKRYCGRFDGGGHTLTVGYTTSSNHCAPFAFVGGASIINLHVTGTINTSAQFATGLVGSLSGSRNKLLNCRVSTVITSSHSGDGTHGGFVGVVEKYAWVTLGSCLFDGRIVTTGGTTNCGGFVGYSHSADFYIVNSLYAPQPAATGESVISEGSSTFIRTSYSLTYSLINSYYTATLGEAQGSDASALTPAALVEALGQEQWMVDTNGQPVPTSGRKLLSGSGTSTDPYIVASAEDWHTMAELVKVGERFSGQTISLTNDIEVSEMVGSNRLGFSAIFKGNGHTLTFNHTATEEICAPFRYVSGTTICGLHVDGVIKTSYPKASGVVGYTLSDDNSILNSRSSIQIESKFFGNGYHSGFVAHAYGQIYVADCLFDGAITSPGVTSNCASIIGYCSERPVCENCLASPQSQSVNSGATIALSNSGNVEINNCYYTSTIGSAQGTDASAFTPEEQVAALGPMWQVVDGKAMPILTGQPLSGSGTEADPYTIATVDDWKNFCLGVSLGTSYKGQYVALTADIDLGSLQMMAGNVKQRFYLDTTNMQVFAFEGTFDGGGHTLTIDYKPVALYCAPFRFVKGATIKNLHTAGTIETSEKHVGGLIGKCNYSSTKTYIDNCRSSVVIKSSVNGDGTHGGLIALTSQSMELQIDNSAYDGKLITTNGTTNCGGLIGYSYYKVTINNSAYAPQALAEGETAITEGSATLCRCSNTNNLTVSNCYYADSMAMLQGSPAIRSVVSAEGISATITSDPTQISGAAFYPSPVSIDVAYTGADSFDHYVVNCGSIGNAFAANGVHTITDGYGDVMLSTSNEAVERQMYLSYDGEVATYYYDHQRSLHAITGDPSKGHGYAPAIPNAAKGPSKVVIDASFKDARPTVETCGMFYFGPYIEEIVGLENLNTSESTDFNGMFYQQRYLTKLDLSTFDVRKVTDMSNMFYGCTNLKSIRFGDNFESSSVKNMEDMFSSCESIEKLDLSGMSTSSVTSMKAMFKDCYNLRLLDISGFNTSNVTNMEDMFMNDSQLIVVSVSRGWTTAGVTSSSNIITSCGKLVGGQGSAYENNGNQGISYCRIDGGTSAPGYFWDVSSLSKTAYVVYKSDAKMLTFTYDRWQTPMKNFNLDVVYNLPTTNVKPEWYGLREEVTAVEFVPEFANVRPTTTAWWFAYLQKLESISGIEHLNTSEVTDMSYMFCRCTKLKSLDVSGFNTAKVTSMMMMFSSCILLPDLDVSGFQTDKVGDFSFMFSDCQQVTKLDIGSFNTSKATNMASMFSNCYMVESLDVSGFQTDNVTNMMSMFNNCSLVEELDVSHFNTEKVDTLEQMFSGCSQLRSLDVSGFRTNKCTRIQEMFKDCSLLETLDVSQFNVDMVKWANGMFEGCSNLRSLDVSNFTFKSALNIENMFYGCTKLENIDVTGFQTTNVTSMADLFNGCKNLTMLNLSTFNTSKVEYFNRMFKDCVRLKTIYVSDNFVTDSRNKFGISDVFLGCDSIVGGAGTTYASNKTDIFMTVIDGVNDKEGYLTDIADQTYMVFDSATGTMTLYGDGKRANHSEETAYTLASGEWTTFHTEQGSNVRRVVLDSSFADARPTTTAGWFQGFSNLTEVAGLEHLNTLRTTTMSSMFNSCERLTTLDLSHFNMKNVTSRSSMLGNLSNSVLLYLPSGKQASDFAATTDGDLVHENYNLVLDEDGDGQYTCSDLRLTDGQDYFITTPFHADEASFSRQFISVQPATVYLPFAFSATEFGNVFGYEGQQMARKAGVLFTPIDTETTVANTPYIIEPNGTTISAQNVEVEIMHNTKITGADELIGVCRSDTVPVGAYCLDGTTGKLNRVTDDSQSITAFSAYFLLPTFDTSAPMTLLTPFSLYEVPTAIRDYQQDTDATSRCYSLDGRQIDGKPVQKGIYIVNGKKRVVK